MGDGCNKGDPKCREEEVARIDMERKVVVAGQEEDETSLLVKDNDGNIIKGVPVYSVHCHLELWNHCVSLGEGCKST